MTETKRLSEEDKEILLDRMTYSKRMFTKLLMMSWILLILFYIIGANWGKFKNYPEFILSICLFHGAIFFPLFYYYLFMKSYFNNKRDLYYGYKAVGKVFIVSTKIIKKQLNAILSNDLEVSNSFLAIQNINLEEITPQTPLEIEYLPKSKYILIIRKLQ